LTALWVFFFPWTREAREEDFSSPAFLLSLPLLNLKKTATQSPHLLTTWWKKEGDVPLGRFGATAQRPPQPRTPWTGAVGGPPPLCFTYKYRGGGTLKKGTKKGEKRKKKKGEEGRTRETREHKRGENRERKKEKKGKKKKRRERKKDEKPYWPPQSLHRDNNTAATGSTASTPPQVTSCCPVLFPLAQPLPAFACRT
jgi:hypothetical protein